MPTRRQLRSDIILRITGGKPSDDFEVDNRQIDFWIDTVRAAMISEKYTQKKTSMEDYTVEYLCLPILNERVECDCPINKYYVDLPTSVLDLNGDAGVYRVETAAGYALSRIRRNEISRVGNLKYMINNTMPSYYRVGERLYFEGGKKSFLNHGKVNLVLIPYDTIGIIDDDAEYPIGGDITYKLLLEVETIARREISIPDDDLNDGDSEIHNIK